MKYYNIEKGTRSTGFFFQPHINLTELTYLVKFKTLNTYQEVIMDQRGTNNLFGLNYIDGTRVGYSFNLKSDYVYLYGYNNKVTKHITRCVLDNWYYLHFKINNTTTEFSVKTFKQKVKNELELEGTDYPDYKIGLRTYPKLDKGMIAPCKFEILMADYTNRL